MSNRDRDFVTTYWPTPGTPGFKIMNMYDRIRATEQNSKNVPPEAKAMDDVSDTKAPPEANDTVAKPSSTPPPEPTEQVSNGVAVSLTMEKMEKEEATSDKVNGAIAY